jgi:hypothetical protein
MKTLAKYHDAIGCSKADPAAPWTLDAGTQYQLIGAPGSPGALYVYSETFFDLAGMSMEEKTMFFEGATVQTVSLPAFGGVPVPGDAVTVIDLMTSIPIAQDKLLLASAAGAGFPSGPLNFEHVIYGRTLQYAVHLDLGTFSSPTLVASNQYGSGMPTASDRIYSYRLILINTSAATTSSSMLMAGARHLLQVRASEEPTYEYLMRLKRSYDLQQTPDVD